MTEFPILRTALISGLMIVGIAFTSTISVAQADEISQRKADKIREMIQLTKADKLIDVFLPIFADQLKNTIKSSLPGAPQKHIDLLAETMQDEMRANSDVFFELMIPQYDSLLSEKAIDDTIAFYKTPSGQELINATPHMATVGAKVGQQWGQMIAPKAAQKARQKARELGYKL
ncbi:MAG: DUF2059 domain-containing protein [Thalassospira sp.]|uniref:DUF2059 domain-containing protein n=1 Tax=Thalassospira sp. TaxID=1912094 RepID=UPI0032EAE1F0|eukprot:TRINITY_DN7877_c0_g2_i1.p1 TRINITY_DN7877_c0_g2~~TRINITY_DN7877_c0_g2_i1.p1  ORF type:complete len:174 (-),score=16.86 TRINITY_DN7877_c0_g2_i1:90-611(-)